MDSKFTVFFEATILGNFESKTTRDQYVARVRNESEVRKADAPNDTNFRFGTLAGWLNCRHETVWLIFRTLRNHQMRRLEEQHEAHDI